MNFIKPFFLTVILLIGSIVALIISVDPYEKYGNNVFGFATKAVAQSRENKFRMLEQSKKSYEAFILGSSAAHRYPTQKLEELTGLQTYNYAVQHSTPIDYLAIVKHILSKHQPKLILLQLDFAAMDETYKVDNRLYNSPLKEYLTDKVNRTKSLVEFDYFTLRALSDTFRVFFVNWFGEARHIYAADGNYIHEEIKPHKIRIKQSTNANYTFSPERLKVLKDIEKLSVQHSFKFVLFSSPLGYDHMKRILEDPKLKAEHENYLSTLNKEFPSFVNFQNLELMEKYDSYEYFLDTTHPTKILSEIVLEKLLAK